MAMDPVVLVRRLTDEPDETTYSDLEINERLVDFTVNATVLAIWQEKMAALSSLVNTSEGGSSRSMSQAFDHAREMIEYFSQQVILEVQSGTVLRKITRV